MPALALFACSLCTFALATGGRERAGAARPEFQFPESEARVTAWITALGAPEPATAAAAADAISSHAWGLWTALTAWSAQAQGSQRLRVFETWLTAGDVAAGASSEPTRRKGRLGRLRTLPATVSLEASRIVGSVHFNPDAARHLATQNLLSRSGLQTLLAGGAAQVPPFPASSVIVKAIYRVVPAAAIAAGGTYRLPIWQGPPSAPQAYGPDAWPGAAALTAQDVMGRFVSFQLTQDDATALNADQPATAAEAGDWAILVAMHVATRETVRWTWQTFWWTPDADNPPEPSSAAAAAQRPPQLQGAARHYAVATAYTTALPSPPVLGGDNSGRALYAYNPYVEAALGPPQLPDSVGGIGPDGAPAGNNTGVQSNCMSCHSRAAFNPDNLRRAPAPAGARYSDLGDANFVGTLQTDLLWSLARSSPLP